MVNWWICLLLVLIGIGAGVGIGYLIFFKKGCKVGAKTREQEILLDYTWYIPVKDLAEFAREAIEERGVEEDYPLLVIRSDKYDYIGGDKLPSELKD